MNAPLLTKVEQVNKELWILLALFAVSLLLNHLVASQRMVLSFYAFPTLVSAFYYGRRHATLTASASVLLVVLLLVKPGDLAIPGAAGPLSFEVWLELAVWGGSLIVTGYMMGALHDHKSAQVAELRDTYHGVLMILRHFISNDEYTENHCYRVSQYAARLAATMGLSNTRIEDVRAAALLHDIGKLDVSRELLSRAAEQTRVEFERIQQHARTGMDMFEPVGGSLRTILPIVLARHDAIADGQRVDGDAIPLEAHIIRLADVYDGLTTDRPHRKAMSPFDARDVIAKGAGTEFDPRVVAAFETLFRQGEIELWSTPLAAA
jgi:putative nucleotidyltransferase with HDIG domain